MHLINIDSKIFTTARTHQIHQSIKRITHENQGILFQVCKAGSIFWKPIPVIHCTNELERENPMNMSVDTEKAFREDQSIHSWSKRNIPGAQSQGVALSVPWENVQICTDDMHTYSASPMESEKRKRCLLSTLSLDYNCKRYNDKRKEREGSEVARQAKALAAHAQWPECVL